MNLSLAGLRTIISFPLPQGNLYVLEKPQFFFPPLFKVHSSSSSAAVNPFTVPTLAQWRTLWNAWDTVTLGMIPQCMIHQKPINLRHKCLFYIGHIPTSVLTGHENIKALKIGNRFLDILLSKALGEPGTEPIKFWSIFEVCRLDVRFRCTLHVTEDGCFCSEASTLTLTIQIIAMYVFFPSLGSLLCFAFET